MARTFPDAQTIERDGTSQAGRVQAALDPSYVVVDERSALDLLAFAQAYAQELRFYDERDLPAGDWSGFLHPMLDDLSALAALVDEPTPLSEADARRLGRPHLALFLAFLKLLRHPRDLINTLTRRHLEFYYEQVLRMSRKAPVPDRVHVLLRLAAGVDQARLPAGSLLRAGKDSLGRERIYRTDRELVVSRAKIARLSSVYVEKEIVGIREARELHEGTREEAFLRMLEIALGDPRPGDSLPKYQGQDVTYALLLDLKNLVELADKHLFMDLSDLDSMMQLKRRRDQADDEWTEINSILEKAGRARLGDPSWKLHPVNPRDFSANLVKAIGGELDFKQDGLPEVDTIDDLYHERNRLDVRAFIHKRLFLGDADFDRMMYLKVRIDNEWREINRILERAGRRKRKDPSYKIAPTSTAFVTNLHNAIGPLDFSSLPDGIATLDAYYDAILRIEPYFYMNAAQLGYLMALAEKPTEPGATAAEWNNVYRLLADAYEEKVYAGRRQTLRNALESATTEAAGFHAVLRIALGKDAAEQEEPLLSDLREFVRSDLDKSFLEGIQKRLDKGDITGEQWARVYRVVELAQRIRERLPEPVAQRETWLNLHAAADATTVVGARAAEAVPGQRPWKTFGQQRPAAPQDSSPPGLFGWAISSPMLLLGQGKRTIVLTLGFRAKGFDSTNLSTLLSQEQKPFGIELSTAKGWLAIAPTITLGDYQTLTQVSRVLKEPLQAVQITLSLGEDAAAIVPPSRQAAGIATSWPMLRWMLRPIWDEEREEPVAHYASFRDLTLAAVHVQTKVEGLTPSSIQNDEAVLNAKKPFEPFGTSPAVGSRFYVGDPEIVIKRLDKLTFHVEWRGAPSDVATHYANYGDVGAFTTEISLVDHHLRLKLTDPAAALLAADATKPHKIEISNIPGIVEKPGETYQYKPSVELPAKNEVSVWPRHFQWELTPNDFKHLVYPAVATQKALEMAAALAKDPSKVVAADYQVKPPYTPKMKSLRVDYTSSTELLVEETGRADWLFHVHPFGISPIQAEAERGEIKFLPRYDHEGELYIGIQNAKPPQTLSLLFQMAEGSASPDLRPVPVEWRYLSGDCWLTLHDGNLLSDTTRGLIDSGIVEIALAPAEPSTRLPGDLYWIRASVPYHPDSLCDTVGIHAQAVPATFDDRGNAPDHHGQKLPPRTITKLAERAAQIGAVEQPYPSRGGRAAEREQGFYTRVSERLRHKQRTLTIWDYERLILERFPELYKVKCIPARPDSPGTVEIIVIPGVRGQSIANPFEPKVPASLIAEIEAYLADKCPAQAALRVRNAHFVPVKVRVGVRFRQGRDEGFYKKRLNEEINRFLSPWAFDEGADITIGGKIFANSIVNFIDERDYVDYVATIKLFSSEDGRTFKLAQPVASQAYFVAMDRPDGVLVAAQEHEIDIITDVGYLEKNFTGINYMRLELDFIVAGSE